MADNLKGLTIQEIDTNMLFEKYTIDEIRNVEKRTRSDIERKKEDLRQMVGERYRDLIEAADTITAMKTSAENVLKSLSTIQNRCHELKQTHMVKGVCGTSSSQKLTQRKQDESEFYGVVSQIKLLLDMPEKIWSAIDNSQYLRATQLYLLSHYIFTNLEAGRHISADIPSSFPVITRQWATISHFKLTILQGCRNLLKKETADDQAVADSLCSIMLLDECNPRQVYTEFLLARTNAVQALFQHSKHSASIKSQICQLVQLVLTTILQIYSLFSNSEDGSLVFKTLDRVTTISTVSQVFPEGSPSLKYLSTIFQGYSPKLHSPATHVTQEVLEESSLEWLDTCQKNFNSGMTRLLSYIVSVKGLAAIRDALWDLLAQDTRLECWDAVCKQVLQKPISVWEDFVRPLFLQRTKEIMQSQFDNTLESCQHHIKRILHDLGNDKPSSVNRDLAAFVWTESPSDVPANAAWISATSKTLADGGGLMMKAKAYTPAVQSLSRNLDSKIKSLLDDTNMYVFTCEDNTKRGPFDKSADNEKIHEYLLSSCQDSIHRLLTFVRKKLQEHKDLLSDLKTKDRTTVLDRVLLLGRLCLALTELSPHLQQCMMDKSEKDKPDTLRFLKRQSLSRISSKQTVQLKSQEWDLLKSELRTCSQLAFDIWCHTTSEHLVKEFCDSLRDVSGKSKLTNATRWDDIEIEEETEKGEKIRSTIRVPCQPSWYVTTMLYGMCEEINRIGGHSVSRIVLQNLVQETTDSIVHGYRSLLDSTKDSSHHSKSRYKLAQSRALQLLFDLKFLSSLLGKKEDSKDNKKLNAQVQTVTEELESCVDPFDLDVFTPHIEKFLIRQIQRCSVLFGALTSLDRHSVYSGTRPSQSGHQEQHNVLPLTTSQTRFPLLPVSSQTQHSRLETFKFIQAQKPKPTASQPIISAAKKESIDMKTSASFYDKLGSLWN